MQIGKQFAAERVIIALDKQAKNVVSHYIDHLRFIIWFDHTPEREIG
jgi:hypothetical protein